MLTRGCLALNASYEPITVTPMRRAVALVLAGKAEIVEQDGNALHAGRTEIPRPAVIRLKAFVRVPRRFRGAVSNTFLFARDGRRCGYCGRHESELRPREFLTRDHVIPQCRFRDRRAANTWANCVAACSSCNNRKADRTPAEAGMPLRVQPTEPQLVNLEWAVRRLTPLQRKYVAEFFGAEALRALED